MNKKLVAITLVLVLVSSGLFALTLPNAVTATLQATLGDYFRHGFVNGSAFDATKTIENAFGDTAPSFVYGYETNAPGPYYIKMAVGDFANVTPGATGTVKIKSITVSGSTPVWDPASSSYTIFTVPSSNTFTRNTATVTISPALLTSDDVDHRSGTIEDIETAAQAAPGDYEALITFSISAS